MPLLVVEVVIPTSDELDRYTKPAKGVYANKSNHAPISVRTNSMEQTLIEDAAKQLGISRSTFIRYFSVQAAKAVKDYHNERDQSSIRGKVVAGHPERGVSAVKRTVE